ncbi:hypothetical protein A5761_01615 [Mycolicibacterium setense]|uniref:hypothetical protein n=1 Tax=Mycolicibacterium setense TaxID=431269 RepID=UPI0007EB61C0|nr:hypothetical protein [Mycolicibacterium setense]OBB14628.1 hypothetical protein A5761_01615 [Mycolicibacterium setense]
MAVDDGHTMFSGSVVSTTGVIPGVQKSCTVKAQDGSVYDTDAEVSLWTLKSADDTDQLVGRNSLGIGWIRPDGSCEFRLNLEFPTPASPPYGYLITVSPTDSGLTRSQVYQPAIVAAGQFTRFTIDLYG